MVRFTLHKHFQQYLIYILKQSMYTSNVFYNTISWQEIYFLTFWQNSYNLIRTILLTRFSTNNIIWIYTKSPPHTVTFSYEIGLYIIIVSLLTTVNSHMISWLYTTFRSKNTFFFQSIQKQNWIHKEPRWYECSWEWNNHWIWVCKVINIKPLKDIQSFVWETHSII